ncbi:uncharacterized protein LOC134253537 [Saccostrea cucullata]|uniref:uncharacterized protein LOC134253537 n=1 Tax=Saccostrea cuccullata TaxID=36930 RepID=UPI002ED5FE9E
MDDNTWDLMCKCHDMKLLPIYCKDCECPVCTKCLTSSHLKHNICDTAEYFEKNEGKLMEAMCGEDSLLEEIKCSLGSKRKMLDQWKTKVFDQIIKREAIIAEVREVGNGYKTIVSDAVLKREEHFQESGKILKNISSNLEFKTESERDRIKLLTCYSELMRLRWDIKNKDPMNSTLEDLKSNSRKVIEELFRNLNMESDHTLASDEDGQIEKITFS